MNFFLQDKWTIKNLTLNLGVRWQYVSPRAEKFNRQAGLDIDHPFNVTTTTGTGAYNGTVAAFNYVFTGKGTGSSYLEPAHKKNFEPRVGFAWTPRSNTVVRAGFGIH